MGCKSIETPHTNSVDGRGAIKKRLEMSDGVRFLRKRVSDTMVFVFELFLGYLNVSQTGAAVPLHSADDRVEGGAFCLE